MPDQSPRRLREVALRIVMDFGETSGGAWYTMGELEGRPVPSDWIVRDHDPWLAQRMRDECIGWPWGDPRRPQPQWLRSFVSHNRLLTDERSYYESSFYSRVLRPARIRDQLRLLVYDGDRFVAWIGGFRQEGEPRFSRREARRLGPLVEPIASVLIAAERMDAASSVEESCDLLVRPDGRVEFASRAAQRWLARPGRRASVRSWTRALERGEEARHIGGWALRWSRLYSDGRVRYLLLLEPPSPVLIRPADRLTHAQREVAELAAAGATIPEIARMTGRSLETARSHLRRVYRALGVGSRAELARELSDRRGKGRKRP